MDQWPNPTIGALVSTGEIDIRTGPFGTQLKAAQYVKQGTPVVNVRNIGYGTIIDAKLEYISKQTVQRLKEHKLKEGDIVFGRKAAVDRHAFIDAHHDGWLQGSDCIRLRVFSERVSPHYLSYCFQTKEHKAVMLALCSSGTTMASLNQTLLCKVSFSLPPRRIQDTIVNILQVIDDKIANNTEINHHLEQMAQAIFKSWFVDFEPWGGKIPGDWREGTLGDVASIISGKRPPYRQAEYSAEAEIPLLGASSIMGYTNSVLYDERILVTGRVGTHGVIQRYSRPCWASDNTLVIKSDFYEFTYQQLCGVDFHNMNRGSTQPLITQTDLKSVPILLPNEVILREFEELVGSLMEQYEANILESERLAEARDTLLPRLMSGKLSVADL